MTKKQKEQIVEISIYTIVTDNGDGGYSIRCYNNIDDLINDHSKYEDDPTQETRELILSGDDEYEYGYLDETKIKLKINKDGKIELAESIYFHAGQ